MNYLKLGAETLQARMEEYGGVTVIYRRPGEFSFPVVAVPGRNPVEIADQSGTLLRGQVQDFVFDIKKLTDKMTQPLRPMRGDEIVVEYPHLKARVVFVVNGEDMATSHYEPSDSYGIAWRIHTKSDRYIDAIA